jgi:uncharacterized protein YbjT (DUF2867 family)
VVGVRLVPLLVAAGHEVAGMTRSPAKAPALERLGAQAVVCDVYDAAALRDAVGRLVADAAFRERAGRRSREIATRFTPEAWAASVAALGEPKNA